eukprot:469899-Rhodomonas_salina.2
MLLTTVSDPAGASVSVGINDRMYEEAVKTGTVRPFSSSSFDGQGACCTGVGPVHAVLVSAFGFGRNSSGTVLRATH